MKKFEKTFFSDFLVKNFDFWCYLRAISNDIQGDLGGYTSQMNQTMNQMN